MKKLISFILALIVATAFAPLCFAYTPDREAISDKAIIMSIDENSSVIYQKNADKKTQPSTLSKIMTAILAIESVKDVSTKTVTASYDGVHALDGTASSYYGIKVNDQYTMLDLIYIMMYRSANDAANVIATEVCGSVNAFVNKMNEKVKALGLKNTFFLNPTGLDEDGQYTTVRDMAIITKYAYSLPVFQQIAKGSVYELKKNSTHSDNTIYNDCELIPTTFYNKYAYDYATGVKSGVTEKSGYCIAATAQKDGLSYVCVVMGGKKVTIDNEEYTSALVDARRLFRWAFSSFKVKVITTENSIAAEVPVRLSGDTEYVSLVPEKSVTSLVPGNVDASTIIIEPVNLPEYITAPVKKGDFVCKAKVIHAGEEIMQINLVAYGDADSSPIKYIAFYFKEAVFNPIFILAAVIIVLVVAFIIVKKRGQKHLRKRERSKAEQMENGIKENNDDNKAKQEKPADKS